MKIVKASSSKLGSQVAADSAPQEAKSNNKVIDLLARILQVITGRSSSNKPAKITPLKSVKSAATQAPAHTIAAVKKERKQAPAQKASTPSKLKQETVARKALAAKAKPEVIEIKAVKSGPEKAREKAKEKPASKEVKATPLKDASGKFMSKSSAEEAQKAKREKQEKREEQTAFRNTLEDVAGAGAIGGSLVGSAIDSSAADAVGTSLGGGDWKAGKQIFDAAKEMKVGLGDASKKISDTKGKWSEFVEKRNKEKEGEAKDNEASGTENTGVTRFQKLFKKLNLFDRKRQKKAAKELVDTVEDQTEDLDKMGKTANKEVVKAIEDNATVVNTDGGGLGSKMKGGFSKVISGLSKFVKVAGGPLAGLLAGGMKYMDVKNDETLSDGQKTAQVASTGGGAMAGAMAGGAAGAALGSFIPFVGTAIGGIIGAAIGGIAGGMGGEVLGEVISDNMEGPIAKETSKAEAQPVKTNEILAGLTPVKSQEKKSEMVKADYVTAQAIQTPKPIKPKAKAETQNPVNKLDPRTGFPVKNSSQDAFSGKQISDPIVKAIDKLLKQGTGTRDAYRNTPIPMEFDSELLTLMAHDKI